MTPSYTFLSFGMMPPSAANGGVHCFVWEVVALWYSSTPQCNWNTYRKVFNKESYYTGSHLSTISVIYTRVLRIRVWTQWLPIHKEHLNLYITSPLEEIYNCIRSQSSHFEISEYIFLLYYIPLHCLSCPMNYLCICISDCPRVPGYEPEFALQNYSVILQNNGSKYF